MEIMMIPIFIVVYTLIYLTIIFIGPLGLILWLIICFALWYSNHFLLKSSYCIIEDWLEKNKFNYKDGYWHHKFINLNKLRLRVEVTEFINFSQTKSDWTTCCTLFLIDKETYKENFTCAFKDNLKGRNLIRAIKIITKDIYKFGKISYKNRVKFTYITQFWINERAIQEE